MVYDSVTEAVQSQRTVTSRLDQLSRTWPLDTVLVSGLSHSLSMSYTLGWYLYVSTISPLARLYIRDILECS